MNREILSDSEVLLDSRRIYEEAAAEFGPKRIYVALSGGTDSLVALHVALALDIPIDGIIHAITGCGIPQTTEFCRKIADDAGLNYIEGNAGSKWEEYVLRKGFFGRGTRAHMYAYHICKHTPILAQLGQIRRRRRNFVIFLLNGARILESANRRKNYDKTIKFDQGRKYNIWVNIIHNWSKRQCEQFLADLNIVKSPVAALLHKSGDCYCGTMQSHEEREEASYWFPEFGQYLDDVERRVMENGFPWGWGESMPKGFKHDGKRIHFQPMCQGCIGQ